MGNEIMLEAMEWLGKQAEDKVTGFKGVVSSISFDLYGCVTAVITPSVNDKGDPPDGRWFDVSRLRQTGTSRVMEPPVHFRLDKGAAEKPPAPRRGC